MRRTAYDIGVTWHPREGPDGLAEAFRQIIGVYREYWAVLAAVTEVASYDATVREFWSGGLTRFMEHSIALIRGEQEAGRVPADVDRTHASRVIVVGGERAIADHVAVSGDDTGGDAAFARELALIWWYGAYQRPAD
jgi:hypothetical protein